MLMSLGTTKVEIYRVKGWSKEFSAKLNVSIAEWEPGIKAGKDKKASAKLLSKTTLNGKKKPKVPKGLVWYTRTSLAENSRRTSKNGLHNFIPIVQFEDDFGINSKLAPSPIVNS